MSRKVIDIGIVGNDGTGDSIRDSFRKVNENFRELYGALGLGSRLKFSTLEDAPIAGTDENYYQGFENAVVAVGQDRLIFKQLVAGTGISLNFADNENEITITNTRSSLANDPAPSLGADLNVQSGSTTHRIYGMDQDPTTSDEAVSKAYADTKISLAGVNAPDPAAGGTPNSAFGTMTGPLILSRDPEPEDDVTYGGKIAATKNYVDNAGYASRVNLYVSTSGADERIGVGSSTQGRALAFAYRSLEAALKKAEEIIKSSPPEIGPYKKILTWTNPDNGVISECYLNGQPDVSPESGTGFAGRVTLTIDTITLVTGGFNYQVGEILKINKPGGADVDAATVEILTVNSEPGTPNGPILTFRLLTGGKFDQDLPEEGLGGVQWSGTTPGSEFGTNAIFNVKYKVSTAIIQSAGSNYSLVSVRVSPTVTDTNATAGFGFADIVSGAIAGITITDGGSGFTEFPTLIVNLPRFAIYTGGQRTDFTGDVTTDSASARRGRDIREGLYIYGETSGALAQILAHSGELDTSGNELFDVDIKYGTFEPGESISYGDVANTRQLVVFVEAGIYYENLPLKVPQNVSIRGDEFRRSVIRPKKGISSSPWAFQYFKRDRVIDGLNTARNEYNAARESQFGYHYLTNADEPVYPEELINNKGYYRSAADLLSLNKKFIQEEVIAWINKNVVEDVAPFGTTFEYNQDLCKRDVGLIIDAMVYDLRWGSAPRTISAALKYKGAATALGDPAIAIGPDQLDQTVASLRRLETVAQAVIRNVEITKSEYLAPITGTLITYAEPQVIDTAYTAETGAGGAPITVLSATNAINCTIRTASAHGLLSGDVVTFGGMTGMTELNGNSYIVVYATPTTFNISYQDDSSPVNSTDYGLYVANSGSIILGAEVDSNLVGQTTGGRRGGGVIGRLTDVIVDIISNSGAVNYPLDNDQMDIFLMNDATILRALSMQGHGGFAMVLDPEGQILAKSPYAQEGAVFSKSTGRHQFNGGMFVDGFAGNIQFRITEKISNTRLVVSDLQRFPQLPASFIVSDQVYRINYVRDFTYGTSGSTATFVLDEITPWLFDVFTYNETVCNRDVGLIIDGLGNDVVFGSNYWSRKAGLSYRQANTEVVIQNQLELTISAIDRAHDLATAEVTGFALSIVNQSKQNLRNIIRRGATSAPNLSIPSPSGIPAVYENAKNLIINNIEFIKAETIEWINSNYNIYDRTKCARDVGLILEAVLNDVAFSSNYFSTTAGLAYYRNLSSAAYVLSDQKASTIAGINYAKSLANAYITDSGIQALITAKFAIVTTIINSGTGSAPSLVYTVPASQVAGIYNTVAQLIANRTFIQEEIYRWIEVQIAGNISPFTSAYTYDSTKCKRDVGYLVDAICYDLMYGSSTTNTATVAAANTYFYGTTVISGQTLQTIAAYGRLKTVLQQIAVETSVTRSSGNVLTQDVSGTAGSAGSVTIIGNRMDNITAIIGGTTVTPVGFDYSLGTTSYVTARSTIIANEETIKTATVDWLEANDYVLRYDEIKCARDVGYILEALAYDLTYGGNSQMWDAAQRYFNGIGDLETQQIPEAQKAETVAAIAQVSDFVQDVIQNITVTALSGVAQYKDLGNPSDSGTAAEVAVLFEIITDTLTDGASHLDSVSIVYPGITVSDGYRTFDTARKAARTALLAAKEDIQTNVITFVNDNANVYEVLMPGNRSMLSNDFTQITDMGYGLIATNGGLTEAVSMFTYYCYTSYYSLNGGQIRSVGGSSAHGVYALAAEGSDPLEVPTEVDLYYELTQGAVVYNDGSAYDNAEKGFIMYVTDYDYPPRDGSEVEVDHGGQVGLVRYPVVSAVSESDFPNDSTGQKLYRLNLNSDTDGIVAEIPNGTRVTLRLNTEIVLTGGVVGVAVRPSTALKLNELFDSQLYRVLEFADYFAPANENVTVTFSVADETIVTSSVPHTQRPGYAVIFATSGSLPIELYAGDTYYILDDGFTDTTFKISATKGGAPLSASSSGSGSHYFTPYKLANTALKDGYNYAELTLLTRQEYVTYGPRLIVTASEMVSGTSYYIVSTGDDTNWVSMGASSTAVGTVFTRNSTAQSNYGTGVAVVNATRCTFDYTSDTITRVGHGFSNGDVVRFDFSTSTGPDGVFSTRQYFVYNKTNDTFQLVGYPGSTTVIEFADNGTGIFAVEKVEGRVGDSSVAIVEVGTNDVDRLVGMKFGHKGRVYTVTQYDSPTVTGEAYSKLYFTPALEDSALTFDSSLTWFAGVAARSDGSQGTLTIRISLTRVTSHDLLEIGTGSYADTNYPNEIYGPPVRIATETLLDTTGEVEYAQIVERGEGRCFFVTTDQFGNFSVGPFFRVDQGTGTVTFSASLALSNLSGLGFKRGVPIAEFSTDNSFSGNATDTVPVEQAIRGYIDRRLGLDHDGLPIDPGRIFPPTTGGYLPLAGSLTMNGNLRLGNNRIRDVADPVEPQDAVNYRSISFDAIIANSFPDQAVDAGYMIAFTGDGNEGRAVKVDGDLTIPGDNAITTGVDSTLNQLNIFIKPDIIDNDNINSTAGIVQSKLSMTLASARAAAPTGTAAVKQAASGLVSFNNAEFTITDGWTELKTNGIAVSKLAQIATDTVLGRSSAGTGDVSAVTFTTVVDEGLAIKKSQYSTTGFLRRTGTTTNTLDADYSVIEAVSGYAGFTDVTSNNKLVIRDGSGDMGARDIYASRTFYVGTSASANKKLSDTSVTATGGSINIYGFNGVLGVSIGDGSQVSDKISTYRNNSHRFRLNDDSAFAPIQVSSITTPDITTGGTTTPGTITGAWAFQTNSSITMGAGGNITLGTGTIDTTGGTLRSTLITTGAVGTAGQLTGNWTLQGASQITGQSTSVIDFSSGTIKSRTFTTGANSTTGNLTGNWSLTSGSKIDFTNGTLQSTTLTAGATATAGIITGQWTVAAGSSISLGTGGFTTRAITTGGPAITGTLEGDWSMLTTSNITWGTGYLDMRPGTFYTDTVSTGAVGTAGVITGNWSMDSTSNLTWGTGYLDVRTGTLYSDTLTTGATGTAGVVTGAWTIGSGSTFVATTIQNQANSATTASTNANTGSTIVLRDTNGDFSAGTISAALSGNASTASKWATARTVTFTGDVTGSFSIDGSANVSSVALTVSADATALGTDTTGQYASTVAVSGTGLSITTPNADNGTAYTITSNATSANTAGAIVARDGSNNFSAGTITATLNGNAGTASAWATGRTITLTGDVTGVSAAWTGSGDISFATTIAANSVALGSDTTGNYVATLTAGTGVSVGTATGEGSTPTISIGQAIGTSDSPTFASITVPSITKNGSNGSGDIGQTGNRFGTVYGTASSALYADLAEKYLPDADYAVGTVVVFGGEKEITVSNVKMDTRVAGVISDNPAYKMNDGLEGGVHVALVGRVPCKVVGKIKKGDMLVTSGIPGVAVAAVGDIKVGSMIGKALENYDSDHIGTIEVAVGRA